MARVRSSISDPIRVDALTVLNGRLGMTFCPGKHGSSLSGTLWARDLDMDLAALRNWGAGLIVTLMERHEFDLLRVPRLPDRISSHSMPWMHLPIVDQGIPDGAFQAEWPRASSAVLGQMAAGGSVILHCRGGLGRTGLVAALLLIQTGHTAEEAIQTVRRTRDGAIETRGQEAYVRAYCA